MTHFPKWGIDGSSERIWLPKARFAVMNEAFIAGEFARDLRPYLDENVGPYDAEDGEDDPGMEVCEDFAQETARFMCRSFRKTSDRAKGGGPGFGPFSFIKSNGKPHSLNCWLALVDDDLAFRHFEPQTQEIVTLRPAEVQSFLNFRMGS
jgi:hypothetical protein